MKIEILCNFYYKRSFVICDLGKSKFDKIELK